MRAYYWRRLTRLEPPYILSLLLCAAVLLIQDGKTWVEISPHLLASIFYVHNLAYGGMSMINPVAWSLEVEVQFYGLAPAFALLFRLKSARIRRSAIIGTGLSSFTIQHIAAHLVHGFPTTLLMHLQYFMVGFLVADIYLTEWQDHPSRSLSWDIIAIPAWALLPFVFYRSIPATSLIMTVALFIVVVATFRSRICRATLASSPIRILGGMCYTIYLLHHRVIWSMAELLHPNKNRALITQTLKYSLLCALLVLPMSIAYFLMVEKPCMRKTWVSDWLNAVRSRRRGIAGA